MKSIYNGKALRINWTSAPQDKKIGFNIAFPTPAYWLWMTFSFWKWTLWVTYWRSSYNVKQG